MPPLHLLFLLPAVLLLVLLVVIFVASRIPARDHYVSGVLMAIGLAFAMGAIAASGPPCLLHIESTISVEQPLLRRDLCGNLMDLPPTLAAFAAIALGVGMYRLLAEVRSQEDPEGGTE